MVNMIHRKETRMRNFFLAFIIACIELSGGNMPVLCAAKSQQATLYTQFQTARCDQRVAVYWYWISDNISVKGVERDLEAMKKAGIDRAFIGNIWEEGVRPGGIKVLSPGWWEVLQSARRSRLSRPGACHGHGPRICKRTVRRRGVDLSVPGSSYPIPEGGVRTFRNRASWVLYA